MKTTKFLKKFRSANSKQTNFKLIEIESVNTENRNSGGLQLFCPYENSDEIKVNSDGCRSRLRMHISQQFLKQAGTVHIDNRICQVSFGMRSCIIRRTCAWGCCFSLDLILEVSINDCWPDLDFGLKSAVVRPDLLLRVLSMGQLIFLKGTYIDNLPLKLIQNYWAVSRYLPT